MKTEIYLLRHGEPAVQQALLGKTDVAVSAKGEAQMLAMLEKLSGEMEAKINYVISSPLKRCADTAKTWAVKNSIEFALDPNWRECDFGDWDGKTFQQLATEYEEDFGDFIEDPISVTPPNGEEFKYFSIRVDVGLQQLLKNHQGKNILLVSHAGVIRNIIAWCLEMDINSGVQFRNFAVDYGSLSQITIYHQENEEDFPCVVSLNQCAKV